jgi:hypothetical protein
MIYRGLNRSIKSPYIWQCPKCHKNIESNIKPHATENTQEPQAEPQAEREEWICPWVAGAVPDVDYMAEAICELQRFAEENRRRLEQFENKED